MAILTRVCFDFEVAFLAANEVGSILEVRLGGAVSVIDSTGTVLANRVSPSELPSAAVGRLHELMTSKRQFVMEVEGSSLLARFRTGVVVSVTATTYESWSVHNGYGVLVGCYDDREVIWSDGYERPFKQWWDASVP